MNNEQLEKNNLKERDRRFELILGIFLAGIFGFLINLVSSVVYNNFFIENPDVIKDGVISFLMVAFVVIVTFLQFIVYDYQNKLSLNRGFWIRFFDYYENNHWLSSRLVKFSKTLFYLFTWFLWIVFTFALFKGSVWVAISWIILTVIYQILKRYFKNKK